MRSKFGEKLSAGAGGWLYCGLSARSRAYMFWGHVPPLEDSEARASINSNGKKAGPALRICLLAKQALCFLWQFLALSCDATTVNNLERVGRSRHRRCDPGRVHRLLHPRSLAMHLCSTNFGFAEHKITSQLAATPIALFHYTEVSLDRTCTIALRPLVGWFHSETSARK